MPGTLREMRPHCKRIQRQSSPASPAFRILPNPHPQRSEIEGKSSLEEAARIRAAPDDSDQLVLSSAGPGASNAFVLLRRTSCALDERLLLADNSGMGRQGRGRCGQCNGRAFDLAVTGSAMRPPPNSRYRSLPGGSPDGARMRQGFTRETSAGTRALIAATRHRAFAVHNPGEEGSIQSPPGACLSRSDRHDWAATPPARPQARSVAVGPDQR